MSHTLLEFALALEIISLGSYALAAYERKSKLSAYAGVQYFIIGSIPSGMLILVIALMYRSWGTTGIEDLDVLLNNFNNSILVNNTADVSTNFLNYKYPHTVSQGIYLYMDDVTPTGTSTRYMKLVGRVYPDHFL
jgi:cytochrome bd-type quinol oxidase subunit 1